LEKTYRSLDMAAAGDGRAPFQPRRGGRQ
jgi:hypothetical protein